MGCWRIHRDGTQLGVTGLSSYQDSGPGPQAAGVGGSIEVASRIDDHAGFGAAATPWGHCRVFGWWHCRAGIRPFRLQSLKKGVACGQIHVVWNHQMRGQTFGGKAGNGELLVVSAA